MEAVKPSVLVTGGAGYIGSHTCKALSLAGMVPVTFDNLSLGRADFVKWGPLVEGDIRDTDKVSKVIKQHSISTVIHFAGLSSVSDSISDPTSYYENNVAGTISLLKGMKNSECDKIVFSSTAAVYGEPSTIPITEDAEKNPINVYGRTKLMCEHILTDHSKSYGTRLTILRYFNACGADEQADVGEHRLRETHLIPRAMMALQGYIDDFQVFGSDFPTPDGTAIRDYIHVSDLAEAHVLAARSLLSEGAFGTFNLGAGKGYSVGELLAEIGRLTGHPVGAPTGGRRPGDPARLVADVGSVRSALGFTATRSSLQNIIASAWRWHQKAHPKK